MSSQGLCLSCRRFVSTEHGDATQKAFECYRCKSNRLQAQLAEVRESYNDLIMQVSIKHPNETGHETAKRYIRNAEHQDNPPDSVTQLKQEGE